MPIYDYKCVSCGLVREEYLPLKMSNCDSLVCQCGSKLKRIITISSSKIGPVEAALASPGGLYLEHVSNKGETFHSKRQLKDYARKHNLQLGALL